MLGDPWQAISKIENKSGSIPHALNLLELLDRLTPHTFPNRLKEILLQTEGILQAERMHAEVASSRIARAHVNLQTGEEKEAIELAEKTIATLTPEAHESLAKLIYIKALAYSRIGELDHAHQMIQDHGIAAAKISHGKYPWITAQMIWLQSEIMWKMHLRQVRPKLWCGPPIEMDGGKFNGVAPSIEDILENIGLSKSFLPPGTVWPFNDILSLTLQGVQQSGTSSANATHSMEKMAQLYHRHNPVVCGWALLGAAVVHFHHGRNTQALANTIQAHKIAKNYHLGVLLRISLVYESRLRELLADFSGALSAQKNLSALHFRSIYAAPLLLEPRSSEISEIRKSTASAHLKKAIDYIDSNSHRKLYVSQVADYCQVSRRTLELLFKKHKQTTVSTYVKKKRMQVVANILLKCEMPMYMVAKLLGYSSQSVFSREFSSHYGLSPRSWLQKRQKDLHDPPL